MSADLDKAIDRAVREMLDVEPPAGLRGRVMERLEPPRRRGAWWIWIAAPAAAAAILFVTVALWRAPLSVRPAAIARGIDVNLPASPVVVNPLNVRPPRAVDAPVRVAGPRSAPRAAGTMAGTVTAASLTTPENATTAIEPLKTIVPIQVLSISQRSIVPADIGVRPLNPIAEMQIAPLDPSEGRN